MMAFVLQRRRNKWTTVINVVMLSGLIIPPAVVPTIYVMQQLELFKTIHGLVLVEIAYGLAFSVLLFQAFISTIPRELDEAAVIDGAGPLTLFFRVVLPLLKPIVITVVVVQTVFVWNDFQSAAVLPARRRERDGSADALQLPESVQHDTNLLFMDILLITVPPLLLFMFFQRQIVSGLTAGSVKG